MGHGAPREHASQMHAGQMHAAQMHAGQMMDASALIQELTRRQNTDGGWGYQGATSTSWTEPTALAVLALESAKQTEMECRERGIRWLLLQQRRDGGWSPNPSVDESTAVTSLACLAIAGTEANPHRKAASWLVGQAHPELDLLARIRYRIQGMPGGEEVQGGSSWFPGTACWVAPTAMSVLALQDVLARPSCPAGEVSGVVERAQRYILSRRCADGGWNHGGTQFRGAGATAYPETTGMALLALAQAEHLDLASGLHLAEQMQFAAESSEGQSWLRMALHKHQRPPAAVPFMTPRTTRDCALQILALHAGSRCNRLVWAGA